MKPWLILLPALALAGCLSERAPDPAAAQAASTAAIPAASAGPLTAVQLVNGRKAVGHRDFADAKKVLPAVFSGLEEDFYCGCPYTGKAMDLQACGYQVRKNLERASRLEWEHVVPAWVLGHQRQCWQQGGRKSCTKTDDVFRMAEGDLVNLVPAIGEVNGDRSNYSFGAWTRNPEPMYGQCRTIVDFKGRRAQPREEVRGRIARIYFYMHERYGLKMSRQDSQLMCAWARSYPVDGWERERDARIVRVQGSGNPFVSQGARIDSVCPRAS